MPGLVFYVCWSLLSWLSCLKALFLRRFRLQANPASFTRFFFALKKGGLPTSRRDGTEGDIQLGRAQKGLIIDDILGIASAISGKHTYIRMHTYIHAHTSIHIPQSLSKTFQSSDRNPPPSPTVCLVIQRNYAGTLLEESSRNLG